MLPLHKYLRNPKILAISLLYKFNYLFSDKHYLQLLFPLMVGYRLDLKNPRSYNEKLNWQKLYDRNPLYTILADKRLVKEWVTKRIGAEFVIPTIGVWESVDDIDFDSLPNQFVLKTTHGAANEGVVICRDKANFDIAVAKAKLSKSMRKSASNILREWPYSKIHRCIIAEQYLEDKTYDELRDYKFFCFDGEVKALFVATGRQSGEVMFDYYDSEFNHLDLYQSHPISGKELLKPVAFEKMKEIASALSKGLPQVRCDLYEVNGNVYFGEMTFFHHGGVTPFHPESWDFEWGKWINLPAI